MSHKVKLVDGEQHKQNVVENRLVSTLNKNKLMPLNQKIVLKLKKKEYRNKQLNLVLDDMK